MFETASEFVVDFSADLGWVLVETVIKSLPIFALAAVVTTLLRSSAAQRHLVWTASVAALLICPVMAVMFPSLEVARIDSGRAVRPSVTEFTSWENESQLTTAPVADSEHLSTVANWEPVLPLPAASSRFEPVPTVEQMTTSDRSVEPVLEETAVAPRFAWGGIEYLASGWSPGRLVALAVWLWALVAIWRLARMAVEQRRLIRQVRAERVHQGTLYDRTCQLARQMGIRRQIALAQSRRPLVPFTCGLWTPFVVLPMDADRWSRSKRDQVLLHELAHIKRGDLISSWMVQLARAIYWFHPLVWLAAYRMQIEQERACDDWVLRRGEDARLYAKTIVEFAADGPAPSATQASIGISHQLESRILAILDRRRRRSPSSFGQRVTCYALTLAMLAPLAVATIGYGPAVQAEDPIRADQVDPVAQSKETGNRDDWPDRHAFARLMNQIKSGMSKQEVIGLLGEPDDVQTKSDPGDIDGFGCREVLRYGTNGHLTTATLGSVFIGHDGNVKRVFGKGQPPQVMMFQEHQLRRILTALDQVPGYDSAVRFNPQRLIAAVNQLQPIGKRRAIAAIKEYLRVRAPSHSQGGREGLFLVLRVLFEIPADTKRMPVMMVGQPWPGLPNQDFLAKEPRFPIVLEGDIPFLATFGYLLAGLPEPPERHLEYFEKHGVLRSRQLVPSTEPVEAYHQAHQRTRKHVFGEDSAANATYLLGAQLMRMMQSVEPLPDEEIDLNLRYDSGAIRQSLAKISELQVRWDGDRHRYVMADTSQEGDAGQEETKGRVIYRFGVSGITCRGRFAAGLNEKLRDPYDWIYSVRVQYPGDFLHRTVQVRQAAKQKWADKIKNDPDLRASLIKQLTDSPWGNAMSKEEADKLDSLSLAELFPQPSGPISSDEPLGAVWGDDALIEVEVKDTIRLEHLARLMLDNWVANQSWIVIVGEHQMKIHQLFQRQNDHVGKSTPIIQKWAQLQAGHSIRDLAKLSDDPKWLQHARIQLITTQTGRWRVQYEDGTTLFRIYPYLKKGDPQPKVYQSAVIKVDQPKLTVPQLLDAIQGKDIEDSVNMKVIEFSVSGRGVDVHRPRKN